MTTRSAHKAEEYSRLASRAMTTFVLVAMLTTGCATRPKLKISDAFDEQAIAAEITASGPVAIDNENQAVGQTMIRKSALAAQAGVLFARSVHIDPINRPLTWLRGRMWSLPGMPAGCILLLYVRFASSSSVSGLVPFAAFAASMDPL